MLLMSNSLKVVSMALVFWASFNLLAILRRMRFIFTRCSDLVPAISVVGSAGGSLTTGAAPAMGRGGMGAGGGRLAMGAAGLGGGGGGVAGIGAAAAAGGGGGGGGATAAGVGAAAAGEGTGTLVLSVSISQITSSSVTESPTAFSHLMSPSEMESAKAGHTMIFTSSPRTLVVYRVL